MAFEGVASTSTGSMGNQGYTENERIEMNASQYPNYQSNENHGMSAEPNPYGAVDEEDDLNENFEEKCDQNVGYRKFIYNNSEQFKSVCGGKCSDFAVVSCVVKYFNSSLGNIQNVLDYLLLCLTIPGLLLLMGSGIHIVWGIFRIFHLYNCDESNSWYLCFVIWSWYIGAIIGSCCAGYMVAKIRKGHLYVCI